MKKYFVLAILLIVSVFYITSNNKDTSHNQIKSIKYVSPSKTVVKSAPKKVISAKQNKVSINSKKEIQKEYMNSLKELEEALEGEEIDFGKILNDSMEKGLEVAIQDMTFKQKLAFTKVHALATKLQDMQLAEDGKSRDDIKKYEVTKPEWMEDREEAIKAFSLDEKLQGFIERKSEEESISNADIYFVLKSCKKSKDCVDRVFYELINANHVLNSDQLEIIKESFEI